VAEKTRELSAVSKPDAEGGQQDNFKSSVGLSLVVHSLILSAFLLKFLFFSEPLIDISQSIEVNFGDPKAVQTADADKLPEKIQSPEEKAEEPPAEPAEEKPTEQKPEEKPAEKETPPAPAEKPKVTEKKQARDEINLKKVKAQQKNALNKLKALSAIDKIRQDVKKEGLVKVKSGKASHIIPAGSALGGLDKLEALSYLQQVDQSIKQQWALPQWLINKPLKARVVVKFNTQGKILSTQVISSSGNNSYDQYCVTAIEKAAPFPSVPEKFSQKFSVDGIVVGFPD
jgi:colicin import membrane protein